MLSRSISLCQARIIRSVGTNIHKNLAFENLMIDALQPKDPILFLWQNSPCIVVGRYQNVWSECDLKATERDNIDISRRFTGGGAVYHDLGNVCFSVVAPKSKYSVADQNKMILDTLRTRFGIEGIQSGRNDLCTKDDNLKFSGQSFRHVREHSLHNGTIMLNVDVDGLGKYLTPDKSKLEAKGVKSVKSRVVNLSTINPALTSEAFIDAMSASFASVHGISPTAESVSDLLEIGEGPMKAKYDALVAKLTSWDFLYGETPKFSHNLGVRRLGAGQFDIKIDVDGGSIVDTAVFSDCLDVSLVEIVQKLLESTVGLKYNADTFENKLFLNESQDDVVAKALVEEIRNWIVGSI